LGSLLLCQNVCLTISRLSSNLALEVSKSRSPKCKVRLDLVALQRLLCDQF